MLPGITVERLTESLEAEQRMQLRHYRKHMDLHRTVLSDRTHGEFYLECRSLLSK